MTELCRLAAKYGTDKTHYTPFYSLLLEHRKENVFKVLEIGIGTPEVMSHVPGYKAGASLRMWEEYFPYALIFGIDKVSYWCGSPDIFTHQADQSKPESYREFVDNNGPFDLIVDDGSHNVDDQLLTAKTLLPFLREGGLYIIEDVNEELPLKIPHSYVQVKGTLTGRCVIING